MNMRGLMYLILLEPMADTTSRNFVSVSRIEPTIQLDKRVSQPVHFFVGNLGYVPANSVSHRHRHVLLFSQLP
jgi:hypothetical protein